MFKIHSIGNIFSFFLIIGLFCKNHARIKQFSWQDLRSLDKITEEDMIEIEAIQGMTHDESKYNFH